MDRIIITGLLSLLNLLLFKLNIINPEGIPVVELWFVGLLSGIILGIVITDYFLSR